MRAGCEEAAKAVYPLPRRAHRIREAKTSLMKSIDEITNVDARLSDMKRDNANIDGNTAMGSMLQIGTAGAKAYNAAYLLTPAQAKAYTEGDIHIHDFDFYALTTTCCQIDLLKLFHGGFSTGHGYLREPQGIASYAALAAIAIQSNQNDQHGGQSVPNFDYSMAEGRWQNVPQAIPRQAARGAGEIYWTPTMRQRWCRPPWTRAGRNHRATATCGWRRTPPPLTMPRQRPLQPQAGWTPGRPPIWWPMPARAGKVTDRETYQAMEGFVHNLNTMHSRAGAQTPFSSINYGTDTLPRGAHGHPQHPSGRGRGPGPRRRRLFSPSTSSRVKEGVNYNPGDPNYDLFGLSCKGVCQAPVPELCVPGQPVQPSVLQARPPGDRGCHHGLPHARDGQRVRPAAPDCLLPRQPLVHVHQPAAPCH